MRTFVTHPARGVARELFVEALTNLDTHRQRSLLALLGVVIGVASVVAMLTIGHNAEREALRQFRRMGVDLLFIQQTLEASSRPDLMASLLTRHPSLSALAPVTLGGATASSNGLSEDVAIVTATPDLQDLAGLDLAAGRFISDHERASPLVVVGAAVARKLSAPGAPIGVGSRLRLGDSGVIAVGVLKPAPRIPYFPADIDNAVIAAPGSAVRLIGRERPNAAIARFRDGVDDLALAAQIVRDLKQAGPGVQVQVQSARQLIEGMRDQQAVHARMLAAIGGISLLVGGVGVMNVMLMGVLERRREIGLRMALGAKPSDIRLMFLIEALALALAGALGGVTLGVGAALVFAMLSGWPFTPDLGAMLLGTSVAIATCLGFGLYPALRAARLDPILALRAD